LIDLQNQIPQSHLTCGYSIHLVQQVFIWIKYLWWF